MSYLGRRSGRAALNTADIPDNSITNAKLAGGTDGQIITYDASGDPVAVGPGTDGQILTSTGAGSPPAFEAFPTGHVLQTEIGTNDEASNGTTVGHDVAASSWTDIVSGAITPSAATSEILINFSVNISGDGGSFALHILRGSEEVGQADDTGVGNRIRSYTSSGSMINGGTIYDVGNWSGVFLDDISTGTAWTSGAITYYIKLSFYSGSGTYRINKTSDDRNNAAGYDGRSSSHIVLQEIAG